MGIGHQWEVDPWVGHQIGLELCQIHVESSIKPERGSDGGHNLANQTVEIGVSGTVNVQITATDVVDGLIINHEGTVGVLQCGVGGQDGVVGLHHSRGHLGGGVDGELQLGLLAIVHGQTLHQQGSEARSSSSSERVEHKESLETSTLVSQLTNTVQNKINDLLANGVVAPGVVVGGVLLASHELLGVEQLSVDSSSDLVNDGRFKINKDSSGDVLASSSLREEGVEAVISSTNSLVRWHLTIGLDTVLQAVELPAGITNLDSSLSNMDGNTLSHDEAVVR